MYISTSKLIIYNIHCQRIIEYLAINNQDYYFSQLPIPLSKKIIKNFNIKLPSKSE